jgi:hypothetical protein
MATENLPTASSLRSPPTGRWLIGLGWGLLLLGLGFYFFQFFALNQYVVPWYAPAMGTAGVVFILIATLKRWTVWRLVALALCLLLTGFEWHFLLSASWLDNYAGPEVGKNVPLFTAVRADGRPFTERDLAAAPTVLLFFRGHW